MNRGAAVFIIVLVLAGLAIYFTLPEGKRIPESGPEDFFMRTVPLISPPQYAVRAGPDLKLQRMLDRINWGTTPSVNRTIDYLVHEKNRSFLPEVVRRINLFKASEQTKAKRYIDLLAELGEVSTLPALIECTDEVSHMVRMAALRGVSRFEEAAATECLLRHAGSDRAEAKNLAMDLLIERRDPRVRSFFVAALEGKDKAALPFAMRVLAVEGGEEERRLIRPFLDHEDFNLRTVALQSLLQMGDPSAMEIWTENLGHPGIVIRLNAVEMIMFAKALPPADILARLARDPEERVRSYLAGVLAAVAERQGAEARSVIREIFEIMIDDARPGIRLKAMEGLHAAGRPEVAVPFLRKIQEAFGNELNEAIDFLTKLVKKQEAGPLLIERFRSDSDLTFNDRTAILEGLADLPCPDAAGLFFEVMAGDWHVDPPVNTAFTLDRVAAFKVHNLGGDIMPFWLDFLEDDDSERAVYLFLNGVRNLEDARAAGALLDLASDSDRPDWIRKEAILSFAFLRDLDQGERLILYADREMDPALSELARRVFWNFY